VRKYCASDHSLYPVASYRTLRCPRLTDNINYLTSPVRPGARPPLNTCGGAWLVPQFLTDGKKWRGVVWNGCADEATSFSLRLPYGMKEPEEVVQVDARRKRRPARYERGVARLKRPMYEWEFIVLL
jgi:hypothetical protein